MFRIIQYGSALVLGAISFAFQGNVELINSFCLVLILLFGIPHGGVDHLIHASTSKDNSIFKYVLKYLMIAAGYILWWLIDPSKALLIFIILSAYHFGQEFVADMGLKGQKLILNLLWGTVILIAPIFYSYSEIVEYFQIIIPNIPADIHYSLQYGVPVGSILLAFGSIFWIGKNHEVQRKVIFQMTSFILLIATSHILLSFVHAFTIYFILFHSLNAFRHQYLWLKKTKKNYNSIRFIKDLVLFSALAVFGMLFLLWFLNPKAQADLIVYFFILTSLITLPHAITLDQFYRFKNKSQTRKVLAKPA